MLRRSGRREGAIPLEYSLLAKFALDSRITVTNLFLLR
jgi:hypothetical protein